MHANSTSVDNLSVKAQANASFPQSASISLSADPKRNTVDCNPDDATPCYDYFLKGSAYYYIELQAEYYFEGWGEATGVSANPTITGTVTHDVTRSASNGYDTLESYFSVNHDQVWNTKSSTRTGQLILSSGSAPWAAGKPITIVLEQRAKCLWATDRVNNSYGTCTYKGSTEFVLESLVFPLVQN